MGAVLNWRMPIEWDDGTACNLDPTEFRRVCDGEDLSAYMVLGHHEPRGWNRSTMPKLGGTKPVMVNPDGTLDCARGPGAPRIVNTQMPLLRFADGTVPVAGQIIEDGTRLILTHQDRKRFGWSWPRLQPLDPRQIKLMEITPAMIEAEEKAEAERAEMEDSPFYGMF